MRPVIHSNSIINGAFILGLLTAIALRAIVVVNHINPAWVRPLWYFAVLGNFVFFYYRFRITQKRRDAIERFHLIEQVESDECFDDESREALLYLLNSTRKSLERLNYLIIFIFSILAILIDLFLTYQSRWHSG